MVTTQRIVVASLEDWDEVWRRNQYLIDSMLHDDPTLEILFVEPPADPIHALRTGRPARPGRGLRVVDGYGGRLRTLQPTKLLPRRFGATADAQLARSVRAAVRRLGWNSPTLWINDPDWLPLLISSGWPCVYDITDDWVLADRGNREHDRLVFADAQLLERAGEVVVCSPSLALSKGQVREVTLIRNAVDVARYRQSRERPADVPESAFALYAGTLHEDRLDVDLVLSTAEKLGESGGSLVLVGPNVLTAHNTARLAASPNVVVLGARPKDSIPAYLQHSHALVVPHIVDDFTDSLDPLKLYEYLAVGRPIVSTPVAGFRELAQSSHFVVGEGSTFVDAVVDAVLEWRPSIERTDVPEWPGRAREMRSVIDRLPTAAGGVS